MKSDTAARSSARREANARRERVGSAPPCEPASSRGRRPWHGHRAWNERRGDIHSICCRADWQMTAKSLQSLSPRLRDCRNLPPRNARGPRHDRSLLRSCGAAPTALEIMHEPRRLLHALSSPEPVSIPLIEFDDSTNQYPYDRPANEDADATQSVCIRNHSCQAKAPLFGGALPLALRLPMQVPASRDHIRKASWLRGYHPTPCRAYAHRSATFHQPQER